MSNRRSTKGRKQSPPTIDRSVVILLGATVAVLILVAATLLLNRQRLSTPAPDFVPAVTGAPRVAVAEDIVDYGDVKLNTTIETVFRVQNVGDQPLHIQGEPQVELVEGC